MTLDTRVYVLDQIDVHELFQFCRDLLGATDQHTSYNQQDTWPKGATDNPWRIGNHLGQGLPALLDVSYRPGRALRTPEQAAQHDPDTCNLPGASWYDEDAGPCDGNHSYNRACWAEVSFDTAYGYRDENGYSCGDLHAEYVSRLGMWLEEKGVRWEWRNEFTGEIHTGYERLIELASGGFEASAWFTTTVLPAIEASRLGGDGRD